MMKNKIVVMLIMLLTVLLAVMLLRYPGKSMGIMEKIDSYRGYTRVISKEEYEFYKYFVERDLSEDIGEEELDKLVKEYTRCVNAEFYLGNQLGLCEPFSFDALKLRMEQENANREAKLTQGEVVYGVTEFTLQTYFQYTLDNLQASLKGYLEKNADDEILEMAEAYYKEHKEDFRNRVTVVYEEKIGNNTELVNADADMLGYLGKADPGLADFLGIAEIGDVYEDEKNYQERRIILKEILYNEEGYENHADLALYRFVRNELYDQVITMVAQNNPVEFE